MILGADHRRLILAAGFIGAIFLVAADTFCRSTVLQFGQELPVGVVTSFVGAPFFLFLLRRRLREGYL
jgi:iron complex transport system permease protein